MCSSNENKNWGHSLIRVAGSNLCQSKVSYKLAPAMVHPCKPELELTRIAKATPVRRMAVGSKSELKSERIGTEPVGEF